MQSDPKIASKPSILSKTETLYTMHIHKDIFSPKSGENKNIQPGTEKTTFYTCKKSVSSVLFNLILYPDGKETTIESGLFKCLPLSLVINLD